MVKYPLFMFLQDNAEITFGETKYGFANQKGGIFKGREVLGMLSSLAIGWESMGIDAAVIRGLACTGYLICILHYITVTDRVHLSDEHRCGFLLMLTHAPGPSSHNYFFSPINSLQFFISFQIV